MVPISASWPLHSKAISKTLRTALLAGTATFGLLIQLIVSTSREMLLLPLLLLTSIYIGAFVLLVGLHRRNAKTAHSILVRDGILSIPRFVLKHHVIPAAEIKSVESYFSGKEMCAVLIGRTTKSPILLERQSFASGPEFEEFVGFLNRFALANCPHHSMADVTATKNVGKNPLSIILITLAMSVTYAILAVPSIEKIGDQAINYGSLTKGTLQIAELYRIASSFFLHSSPFHLGLNILSLAIIGPRIDAILGRARFLNIFFLSAISGSLASLLFSPFETVVGCSGGILGIFAAYFLVCAKYYRQLPGSLSISFQAISLALAIQVLADLTNDAVDISSHFGGFLFGLLYTSCVLRRRTVLETANVSLVESCIAATATFAYVAGLAYFFSLYFSLP
jgi:rhomboid protease GluP